MLTSLLQSAGALATAVVLYYGDRFLDRHINGSARTLAGPVPFWWVFAWALALGWGLAFSTGEDPALPIWAWVSVFAVLLIAAIVAFCARFGLRPRPAAKD